MYSCINQYNYVYVSGSNQVVCLDTLIDKTDLISEVLLLSVYLHLIWLITLTVIPLACELV